MKRLNYIDGNGKMQGPIPLHKLNALFRSGEIDSTTQVCEVDSLNWIPYHKLLGFESPEIQKENETKKSDSDSLLGITRTEQHDTAMTRSRYPALRIVAGIYRVLAVLVGIAAIIVIIVGIQAIGADAGQEGLFLIFGGILGGLIGVVTNLAVAEGILVFLDIEEHTRNTYSCIQGQQNEK